MGTREHLMRTAAGVDHFLCQDSDGTIRVESHQDLQPFLERNKSMYTHNDGYNKARDMRRVASIPMMLALKWKMEEGWDCFDPKNEKKLRERLNDPDYLYLRTAPGRI